VLDAAARLFAERGVHRVTLREVAAEADVQLTLIGRYIGKREQLIAAVYERVSAQLVAALAATPLQRQPWGAHEPADQWLALLAHHAHTGTTPGPSVESPVRFLAGQIRERFGYDERSAALRASQVMALALGWRLFEGFLLEEVGLGDLDRDLVRDDLNAIQHRFAADPWTLADT
jgi:AcrR family transcriptional regulator